MSSNINEDDKLMHSVMDGGEETDDGNLIEDALNSKGYKRLFSKKRLKKYREENHYPDNDQLCREAIWLSQKVLLGTKSDMDDVANAIQKVYENRDKLA